MGKNNKKIELATSAINPFAPRLEGAEPSNTVDDWWKNTDTGARFEGDKLVSINASPETIGEWKGILKGTEGEFEVLKEPAIETFQHIEFKPSPRYAVNVDNVQNMNDVRHILRLLDITMSEEYAQKLPLHLVKHIVTE
jgi:hypothetical protein